jgi:hypothetical protein
VWCNGPSAPRRNSRTRPARRTITDAPERPDARQQGELDRHSAHLSAEVNRCIAAWEDAERACAHRIDAVEAGSGYPGSRGGPADGGVGWDVPVIGPIWNIYGEKIETFFGSAWDDAGNILHMLSPWGANSLAGRLEGTGYYGLSVGLSSIQKLGEHLQDVKPPWGKAGEYARGTGLALPFIASGVSQLIKDEHSGRPRQPDEEIGRVIGQMVTVDRYNDSTVQGFGEAAAWSDHEIHRFPHQVAGAYHTSRDWTLGKADDVARWGQHQYRQAQKAYQEASHWTTDTAHDVADWGENRANDVQDWSADLGQDFSHHDFGAILDDLNPLSGQ